MKPSLIEAAARAGLKPKANGYPSVPPEEKRTDKAIVLFEEPTDDILTLGAMLVDAKAQLDLLKGLAISGEAYRGNLRMVRGAAVRMAERCKRLLGEQ